jgi:hypothetical protein
MNDRVLLVDLENVQTVNLAKVPDDAEVMVFYGLAQKNLPEELVVQAQPLGTRLQWIKIAGQGPNALDFHIAYYLGKTLTERPQAHCAVLSKDKGFDPLIRHLHGLGHVCRRVATLKDAFPAPAEPEVKAAVATPPDDYSRLVTLLRKEKTLPVKRRGLEGKVKSWFLKLGVAEHRALAQRLFDEGLVVEAGTGLTFRL